MWSESTAFYLTGLLTQQPPSPWQSYFEIGMREGGGSEMAAMGDLMG